jgi:gluconate 5-dehydrogenase
MNNIFNLVRKVIVVTGGYGHIGSVLVEGYLEMGGTVIVAGRTIEKYENRFPNRASSKLDFVSLDVLSAESIQKAIDTIVEKYGKIDVLVNNAHSAKGKGQDTMPDEDWSYTMEGVLGTVHKMMKAISPVMKNQKSGKIINVASIYGVVSPDFRMYEGDDCEKYTNPPHYGAAKAGIIQLTKYFAVYLGRDNIQVNAITPGPFPKESIQVENKEFIKRLCSKNPLNKIGKPEDLKGVSVLLASNASDFITGQNLIVDGGWTIW